MSKAWWVVPLFSGILIGTLLRRRRERQGRRPTVRDGLLNAACVWALAWLSLAASTAPRTGLRWPPPEAWAGLMALFAFALAPLVILLVAVRSTPSSPSLDVGDRKPFARHPLDSRPAATAPASPRRDDSGGRSGRNRGSP